MILALLKKYRQYSDEKLVEKYQKSLDTYYVAILFERYNELTVSISMNYLKNKMDVEDATMDCFETLVKDLKDTKIKNFGGWYYSVLKNLLLKYKRQNSKKASESVEEFNIEEKNKESLNIETILDNQHSPDLIELIESVIKELKPEQEKAITKFYLENKSYQEVAKEMKVDDKKVKSLIQNGKRNLRIKLENKNINSSHEIL